MHLLRLYGGAAARAVRRGRKKGAGDDADATERPVFVVGAPRSGTTFMGRSLGTLPGFVDLGEVEPLKASVVELIALPEEEAARRVRQTLERVRTIGLARRLRAIEQTPEMSFLLAAAVRAYPQAKIVHIVRDGRDVVCSLLEKGWLNADRGGADDVGGAYGPRARAWVEPERADEFERTSDARRAAWAWRRYLTAARTAAPANTFEARYEELVANPGAAAEAIGAHVGADFAPLVQALAGVHSSSVGRCRRQLSEVQVAEIEAEAGPLLRELGYT